MSSLANEGVFESLLRRSLVMLEQETPELYRRLCTSFRASRVFAQVDQEQLLICDDDGRIAITTSVAMPAALPEGAITVRTQLATIAALFEGELSLLDVVLSNEVHLVGALAQLLAVHEALGLYLRAAVRCVSAPGLLAELRVLSGGASAKEHAGMVDYSEIAS